MIILHSKNYKIFQSFGFPKMEGGGGGGGGGPTKKKIPTTYEVAKSGFEISRMHLFKKSKKTSYVLDVQVARKNVVWPPDYQV